MHVTISRKKSRPLGENSNNMSFKKTLNDSVSDESRSEVSGCGGTLAKTMRRGIRAIKQIIHVDNVEFRQNRNSKVVDSDKDESHRKRNIVEKKLLSIKDYELIKVLGKGSFGTVILARKIGISEMPLVAIKRMVKSDLTRLKQVDHIVSEKKVLQMISHPFLVDFITTFKDSLYLYIVLEFVSGGEFFTHLRSIRRFDTNVARFYAAQVITAFEYLHSKDIIYRDLKPENILIAKDGYLKITDFGFAKIVRFRSYTLCGTPEYIAPEVLLSKGHGKAVDWWTLGIFIYEMLVGYPPFFDEDPLGIYEKILAGRVTFPRFFDNSCKDLVKHLLTHDLTKRYGNLKNGVRDIKYHKWFDSFKWNDLLSKTMPAPFVPQVTSAEITTNLKDSELYSEDVKPIMESGDPFKDW